MVDLRPAGAETDIEPVAFVDAGGDRLVEPAMLGFRFPIRAEIDGLGGGAGTEWREGAERDTAAVIAAAAINVLVARIIKTPFMDLPSPVYADGSSGSSIVLCRSRNLRRIVILLRDRRVPRSCGDDPRWGGIMKNLLAVIGDGNAGPVLEAALRVARRFNSHIVGLHSLTTEYAVVFGGEMGFSISSEVDRTLEREGQERRDMAQAAVPRLHGRKRRRDRAPGPRRQRRRREPARAPPGARRTDGRTRWSG